MPVSVDTRVRVDRFWKIIATDFPSSSCVFCFQPARNVERRASRGAGRAGGGVSNEEVLLSSMVGVGRKGVCFRGGGVAIGEGRVCVSE